MADFKTREQDLRKRNYHVFLSHAHANLATVERIRKWLDLAGLNVWFDAERVQAGGKFASSIVRGIAESQSMIVALTQEAVRSEWVDNEANSGVVRATNTKNFPVIPMLLDECEIPTLLETFSAVRAFRSADEILTGQEASRVLSSIHGTPDATPPAEAKRQIIQMIAAEAGEAPDPLEKAHCPPLYLSFGWRNEGNEKPLRTEVCKALDGFCLIGDAVDHPSTNPSRVAAIMKGCEAHVVVIPLRGTGRLDDHAYKSLLSEIVTGAEAGLPQHFILEKGVELGDRTAQSVTVVEPREGDKSWTRPLDPWVDQLRRAPSDPSRRPHYVFVASDYKDLQVKDHVVRHISKITGLPCLKGSDFAGKTPSRKIECAIRGATLVIANIVSAETETKQPVVNWNTCIEAGIALGAGKPTHIIARRKGDSWTINKTLPFMIRDNNIATYEDDASLIALIHQFCRPFRRRTLNGVDL